MRHALIIGLIAFAPLAAAQTPPPTQSAPPAQSAPAAPPAPPAQKTPSPQQTDMLTAIARCLAAGLPQDWYEAQMTVTLDEPGGAKGDGSYKFSRQLSRAEFEPFTPCSYLNPAKLLVEMRGLQPSEQRQWKSARLALYRDGRFDLNYDYSKPQPSKEP